MVAQERVAPVIPGLQPEQHDDGQTAHEGEEGGQFDGREHGKVAQGRGVGAVVQHAGVGTSGHDGGVGRKLRAMAAKLVQQFGLQVIFAGIFTRAQQAGAGLHGAYMGGGADGGRAAHGGLLAGVFDQA